jgi:hypothetical protein
MSGMSDEIRKLHARYSRLKRSRDNWRARARAAEIDARKHRSWMQHLENLNRERREAMEVEEWVS